MKEDGGQAVRGSVVPRPELSRGLVTAPAIGDGLVPAAGDLVSFGGGEPGGGGVDAGAGVGDGLEGVPGADVLWLHALEAGDELDG